MYKETHPKPVRDFKRNMYGYMLKASFIMTCKFMSTCCDFPKREKVITIFFFFSYSVSHEKMCIIY